MTLQAEIDKQKEMQNKMQNTVDNSIPFGDLLHQVTLLDRCLQQCLTIKKSQFDSDLKNHSMQGLAISYEEVDSIMQSNIGMPIWAEQWQSVHRDMLEEFYNSITEKSRLGKIKNLFALCDEEIAILLISMLPFFDPRYNLMFAFMQDNIQKRLPTIDLVLMLLSQNYLHKIELQQYLTEDSALVKSGLLTITQRNKSDYWFENELSVDTIVFDFCLHKDAVLPNKQVSWINHSAKFLLFDKEFINSTTSSIKSSIQYHGYAFVNIQEQYADGIERFVFEAAYCQKKPLIKIDSVFFQNPNNMQQLQTVFLFSKLYEAVVMIDGRFIKAAPEDENRMRNLCKEIERLILKLKPVLFFIHDNYSQPMRFTLLSQINLKQPSAIKSQQLTLFSNLIKKNKIYIEKGYETLFQTVHLPIDNIEEFIGELHIASANSSSNIISKDVLTRLLFERVAQDFDKNAQRVVPVRNWDDLVVSEKVFSRLQQIISAIRAREKVLHSGFAKKIGYGFGISALFHGESGTGKTMVAEVLAGELGVDLIKVDLSTVVNKYIGETEKNLSKIFDKAERDCGVLFFDEADALFGKRSEVKDAQDRHANIEVAYLLQRLENFPGLVILATNNRSHLDDAFTRRITFTVHFDYPDKALRRIMWQRIWPDNIELDEQIDFDEIADKVEMTGANIRNTALLASWMASSEKSKITRNHIVRAISTELEKSGRINIFR